MSCVSNLREHLLEQRGDRARLVCEQMRLQLFSYSLLLANSVSPRVLFVAWYVIA